VKKKESVIKKGFLNKLKIGHVFFIAFVLYCLSMTMFPIPGEDLWWMLKTGQLFMETGQFFYNEIFSYTAQGKPWLHHEWLIAVLFYLLYKAGGFPLLYAMKSVVILSSFVLCSYLGVKRTGRIGAAGLAGIWMIFVANKHTNFDMRAFIFTYLFLAFTLYILEEAYYGKGQRILYLMIPLTLFWVNSHGGYILSYVLQAFFIFVLLFKAYTVKNKIRLPDLMKSLMSEIRYGHNHPSSTLIKDSLITFVGSILIGTLNPYVFEIFLYPFSFWHQGYYKEHIIEWRAPEYFSGNLIYTLSLIVLFICLIAWRKKFRLTDYVVFAAFSYLSFTTVRHITLFALSSIPIASIVLVETGKILVPKRWKMPTLPEAARITGILLSLIAILIFSVKNFSEVEFSRLNMEYDRLPVGAVQFLKLNKLPGNMYNSYEWGGYIIWKLYPEYKVMIDGRANTVYPEQLYKEHIDLTWGSPGWEKILDKYNVNYCICNKGFRAERGQKLIDRLDESPDWEFIYQDAMEVIFIRNTPENKDIIEKAKKNQLNYPRTPYLLDNEALAYIQNPQAFAQIEKNNYEPVYSMLREALSINPRYIPAMEHMCFILLQKQDLTGAEKMAKNVLYYNERYPRVNYFLGQIYERKKDNEKALKYYYAEIENNPGFAPAEDRIRALESEKKK